MSVSPVLSGTYLRIMQDGMRRLPPLARASAKPVESASAKALQAMVDAMPQLARDYYAAAGLAALEGGCVHIGIDPGSPEGDVSVRFLSREEFYSD